MPDDRIPVNYTFDPVAKEIHRKKGNKDELIEDRVVAKYDPDTRIVTFKNSLEMRNFKVGVITFLGENEMPIREFKRADLKADKSLKEVPPRPKKEPNLGDKTPAVVQWYFVYQYNTFCTRYGVIGKFSGTVSYLEPVWLPRPEDHLPEFQGQVKRERQVTDVLVATRAVCGIDGKRITYTPDECVGFSEDDQDTDEQHSAALMAEKGED
jgi:hypothetical protein